MPYQLKSSDVTFRNISFAGFRLYKSLLQKLGIPGHDGRMTVVFLLGIQRSGTSLMYWVFERDLGVKVYREASELSSFDEVERIRLNPLPLVREQVERHRLPMVVLKPLVESQRANELLATFPRAKALWAYRHYQDVAASNLKAFGRGNGISDLQPLLRDDPENWRSQYSSAETRRIIRDFYTPDMNPHDAAALFWWARMQLFFEQGLDKNPNVLLSRYEDLVTNPPRTMRRVYAFLDRPFPGDHITKDVNAQSLGKGRETQLSQGVDELCGDMLSRLNRLNEAAMVALDLKIADEIDASTAAGDETYAGEPAK